MYSYTFDKETGGLLLNSTPTNFSKEPRPVYAQEMDLLGFADYWQYEPQNETPYMWAEANAYWYRGELIARIKGGDLYRAPVLTPVMDENGEVIFGKTRGETLRPIDLKGMCKKNEAILTVLENATVKRIVEEYEKRKKKLDVFEVAFSGGKDSAVLLDLVKKALPVGSFVVIFGDTGMEFPDTYEAVSVTKKICEADGTPFYIARSNFNPKDSWKMFGPPARVLRWCCSVHKSAPQTLKLREITGKNNYVGLDFVGVRAHESIARSTYEYESFGKKQRGQYSFNPILEWTSAEVWLYIFANDIFINKAYKKGNSRAGCLYCPMSGGCSDYFRYASYSHEIDCYVQYIYSSIATMDEAQKLNYVQNGGWNARKNGRDLSNNQFRCIEREDRNVLSIEVINPTTDWKEWIKTIGQLRERQDGFEIEFLGKEFEFAFIETVNGYKISISSTVCKDNPKFSKLFRQVFRKAAYCGACRVCEANCNRGCISFTTNKVHIEDCIQCHNCHDIDDGCLLFHSLRHPQGGGNIMKSINSFTDHAPKREWLVSFFELKERFFTEHSLGPAMYDFFRRFLRDAGLNDKNHFSPFAEFISRLGWETETALGLIMINVALENPQIEWYIKNLDIGVYYERNKIRDMLLLDGMKEKSADQIIRSYKRITNETPIGTVLNFGSYTGDEDLVRTKWTIVDNRVVLYGLYKFVEACNLEDREFHLSYLFDDSIDRDAVSPVRLFGIYDEEEWKSILLGLSARYPEFINATFTNDLKTISLKGKTSAEVLELFEEDL